MLSPLLKPPAPVAAFDDSPLPPHPIEVALSAELRVDAATEPPERICFHCGSGIYASPRALTAHCPGCRRLMNLRNVDLRGEVLDTQSITAGTITVHADARVSGELLGGRVVIAGRFLGTIGASHRCIILGTGKVAGHIVCRHLTVEPGAEMAAEVERIET